MTTNNKTIDTLIQDIHSLLESEEGISREDCDAFGVRMAEMLYSRTRPPTSNKGALRMSSIGKNPRVLWYKNKGHVFPSHDGQTRVKFLYGDILEELLLTLATAAGHSVTDRQRKVELAGVEGSIDAIIDGVHVDVKSASSFSFDKFKKGDLGDDAFGYVKQLSGYSQALKVGPVSYFWAIDKTTAAMCLMPLHSKTMPDIPKYIATLREILDRPTPPPAQSCVSYKQDQKGGLYLGTSCQYCPLMTHCHPSARAVSSYMGKRYYVSTKMKEDAT